jgi:hypothetical protein
MGVNGKVHKMKFKVCTKVEMHNKLLVSKLDFLLKTCWPKKTTTIEFPDAVTMEEYYFLKKIKCVQ